MRSKLFGLSAFIILTVFMFGCASTVRFDYRLPSMKDGAPYAVIKEKDLKENFVTSTIKGFYTDQSQHPKDFEAPYVADSDAKVIGKLLYSVTPWGIATHAVQLGTGRIIAVPPGKIGILISRYYYKELSEENICTFSMGEKYNIQSPSLEAVAAIKLIEGNSIVKLLYEEHQWEDLIWATLDPNMEYTMKLSANKLLDAHKRVVGGRELGDVEMPQNLTTRQAIVLIYKEGRKVIGTKIVSKQENELIIEREDGVEVIIKRVKD
ncbi:MAG TPA: hypothetical protein VMW06_09200 [Desulfobacterales bacterium]|nr:hypothetical protein [Desulfobacterales bacterium]